MKILVTKNTLNTALSICGKAVSKSVVIPIQDCYLFDISNDTLTISGCNNSFSVSHKITIEDTMATEKFAVSSGILKALIGQLVEQPLVFEFENNVLTIHAANGAYTIPYEDGYLFPIIENKALYKFKMDGELLAKGIDKALFAVMDDRANALSSLYMEIDKDCVTLTASNHALLSTFAYPAESSVKASVTIPKHSAAAILALKSDTSVVVAKNSIGFYESDTSVVVALSNSIFPDHRAVIGCSNDKFIDVNRQFLRGAINRANVFSNHTTWKLKLELKPGKLTIIGEDEDLGQCGTEVMDIDYNGEQMLIGCSGTLMSEALGKLESEDVNIALLSPKKAIVIREAKVEKEVPENLMLVMPMMLL